MNLEIRRALNQELPTRAGRVQRRITLASLLTLSVVAIGIVLLRGEVPENDVARVLAVGDLKTNGEHWVIFRMDAPRRKGVWISNLQVIGTNNFPTHAFPFVSTGEDSAQSFPDSTVPIYEPVKAGSFKNIKVRHSGGGEWRVRLCLIVRLGFRKQYAARIESCWRSKSLKPWTRNYVERGYAYIESGTVITRDSGIPGPNFPPPPSSPTTWSPMDDVFSLR